MKKSIYISLLLASSMSLSACTVNINPSVTAGADIETSSESVSEDYEELNTEIKDASEYTVEKNEAVYQLLDFDDETEKENAEKGFIAAPDTLTITDESGKVIWSQDAYSFVDGDEAPATANPSLWRNTQLNHIYGLFEVCDGIYQVRGYDMTNITFIEGDTGWIVFDPLMVVETSSAALELVNECLGERPVSGVMYSHSHVDHYGGVKGIISDEEAKERNVPILAPEGFTEHAVKENVYAGTAMSRRAGYQYGTLLESSETGRLCIGIGMGQSLGNTSFIIPTKEITQTGETMTIDGVTMEFMLTPGTEAPAEMNVWFPEKNALWMAENCTGTLHNLYTLRGAEVRDGNKWAEYIMEAITRYGADVEVVFQSHNWPHFGNEQINEYMINTAAVYKFINDQTLMYINQGYTSDEIAHMIKLPSDLEKVWYTRQYYGTVAHDSKAVYQKYMGWYDANPVNLGKLPLTESAAKFVEYMGGDTDKIIALAREDFDKGEYQWVAEIMNILVFNDPQNTEARLLEADALEQLGYSAESGTWRNAYLSAAKELREGNSVNASNTATGSPDIRKNMTVSMMLDFMGINLDSNSAEDVNLCLNLKVDGDKPYVLRIHSGVLLYQEDAEAEDADATITTDKAGLFAILQGSEEGIKEHVQIDGDEEVLTQITGNYGMLDPAFNIIEP